MMIKKLRLLLKIQRYRLARAIIDKSRLSIRNIDEKIISSNPTLQTLHRFKMKLLIKNPRTLRNSTKYVKKPFNPNMISISFNLTI